METVERHCIAGILNGKVPSQVMDAMKVMGFFLSNISRDTVLSHLMMLLDTDSDYLVFHYHLEDGQMVTGFAIQRKNKKRFKCSNLDHLKCKGYRPIVSSDFTPTEWNAKLNELETQDSACLKKVVPAKKDKKKTISEEKDEKMEEALEFVKKVACTKEGKWGDVIESPHWVTVGKRKNFVQETFNYYKKKREDEEMEQKSKPRYSLALFTKMDAITDWNFTYFLVGESGCGKTQFAMAHFKCFLIINHLERLVEFEPKKHDGIIFDDLPLNTFKKRDPQLFIDLFEMEIDRMVIYNDIRVIIPSNTKKIFVHNNPDLFNLDEVDDFTTRKAIMRRLKTIFIRESLFS